MSDEDFLVSIFLTESPKLDDKRSRYNPPGHTFNDRQEIDTKKKDRSSSRLGRWEDLWDSDNEPLDECFAPIEQREIWEEIGLKTGRSPWRRKCSEI